MTVLLTRDGNNAVNTTASVAYGWAVAKTQIKSPFGVLLHCVIDGPTDGQTDQQIDTVTYRVARTQLKT